MTECRIKNNAVIISVENVEYYLNKLVDVSVDINEVISSLKENESYYIDTKFNYSTQESPMVKYMWVYTGVTSSGNKPIFISLIKNNETGRFEGDYVGVPKFLADNILNYYPNNSRKIRDNFSMFCSDVVANMITETDDEIEHRDDEHKILDITSEIYCQLIYNGWERIDGLDRYIKVIGSRISSLIKENKTKYYIINNSKSVIVNTGLIGQFNEDILIMYKYNVSYNSYKPYRQICTKKEMLDEGFTREQVDVLSIAPIKFFDDDDFLRNVTISDFDINPRNLEHIITERRERFPADIIDCPCDVLATKIFDSLNTGLKMLERDYTYAKPTYSSKINGISWFLPLHIYTSFSEEPELVMVIKKDKEGLYYEVKTIIPYDDNVKDRITAVALYRKYW